MKDTSAEASSAKMIGQTIPSNMSWTMPPEKASGRSATQSMKVMARTASRTSLMPSTAASFGDLPMRRWRSMEWMSMMESSTRRPMESSRPISVELFSVIPNGTMASRAMRQRDRDRDDRDQRAAQVPQEEEHDEAGEQDGDDQLLHHVVHQEADEGRVVVGDLELEAGKVLLDLRQLGLDVRR